MSNNIKPEELKKVIRDYLDEYIEDINDDVKETTNVVIKDARDELIKTSPRSGIARNTKYYKGWSIKTGGKTRKRKYYSKVVWNKTNYQLTHLLEFGHHKRDGTGWVEAKPHIQKVEEKYKLKFADLLEKKIKRRSK